MAVRDVSAANSSPPPQNTFEITEFRVLGNHVLPPTVIERAVYPFLGPGRTIDTVKQAADALQSAYKAAGYGTIFVDIPEQDVDNGLVRLKVTEGTLEQLHIRGERYFSRRQILAGLPSLEIGKTPNLPELQQELTTLNARTPDRAMTPILKAGSQPGAVDVDIAVKDNLPLHGSLQYDNRHTSDTTPNRLTAALSYDNLWQRQDSIGVGYQTAPAKPSDAEVFSANYSGHVDRLGGEAQFSYIRTSSNVLALGTLGVLGKGSIYGAHWQQPVLSTASTTQNVNFGVDYKDVLTSVAPDPTDGASSAAVEAKVRYINWSLTYAGGWFGPAHSLVVTTGLNFGVRNSVNSPDEFENARYNAKPDYFYLRAGFNGNEKLPFGLGLTQRFSAQWADSPLVNNEQFSAGGADSVRGYLEAETLGDSGLSGTLELHSPPLGAWTGSFLAPLYGFVFVDGGVATIVNALPGQRVNTSLWSTGIGLHLESSYGVSGTLDYAIPQRDGVRTLRDKSRIDFLLRYGF